MARCPGREDCSLSGRNAFFERRVMPVGRKPLFGRVVLHAGQLVLESIRMGSLAQDLGFQEEE